jgi:hypothetical protein
MRTRSWEIRHSLKQAVFQRVAQHVSGQEPASELAQTLFRHGLNMVKTTMPMPVSQVQESPLRTQISRFGTFLGQDVARFASAPWHPPP